MSCSTGTPVSQQLQDHFREAVTLDNIRFFIVRVQNDECVEVASHPKCSLQEGFNALKGKVDGRACYVLMRLDVGKSWLSITYVPAGTNVKDKMVLAATKSTLLDKLGFQYFSDEMHANSDAELSWAHYQGEVNAASSDALSSFEKERIAIHKAEDEERNFRQSMYQTGGSSLASAVTGGRGRGRGGGRGGGGVGVGAAGGGAGSRASNIGGYHAVNLPLTPSAVDVIKQFGSGQATLVEIKISESKDKLEGGKTHSATAANIATLVNTAEPRYYLFANQGKKLFIYLCPDKSPRGLRMVYSTGKGSVAGQAQDHGVVVDKSVEVSDPAELTANYFNDLFRPSYGGGGGGVVNSSSPSSQPWRDQQPEWAKRGGRTGGGSSPSRNAPTVSGDNAHPVYSLMGGSPNRRGKKIVLPPKGAY